jgi:hypothetical protein
MGSFFYRPKALFVNAFLLFRGRDGLAASRMEGLKAWLPSSLTVVGIDGIVNL